MKFSEKFEPNPKQVQILKMGPEAWNNWRKDNMDVVPMLAKANLCGASLAGVDFIEAILGGANLSGANLRGARFHRSNLVMADLSNADLREAGFAEARLHYASLQDANLRKADLVGASFSDTNLSGANLSRADLSGASFLSADLTEANLKGANLRRVILVDTKLLGADLRNTKVYGSSVWNVETDETTKQNGLIITKKNEPKVIVDDIEVAQFIYLLLNRVKLRNIINTMARKGVLILGRFGGGGLDALIVVQEQLRNHGYVPMLFDFERPRDRDYTETVKTLVGLSRFVVVDVSGPSVPQELTATVPDFAIPFVPILEEGQQVWSMALDLSKYPWFLWPPVPFSSKEDLIKLLPEKVIAPAEEKSADRQRRLDELFHQRK